MQKTLVLGLGNPLLTDDSVGLRVARELRSLLSGRPDVVVEEDYWGGLRLMERATKRPAENPFAGMRATLLGGFCLVAGAILVGSGGPWPVWVALLVAGVLLPLKRGR